MPSPHLRSAGRSPADRLGLLTLAVIMLLFAASCGNDSDDGLTAPESAGQTSADPAAGAPNSTTAQATDPEANGPGTTDAAPTPAEGDTAVPPGSATGEWTAELCTAWQPSAAGPLEPSQDDDFRASVAKALDAADSTGATPPEQFVQPVEDIRESLERTHLDLLNAAYRLLGICTWPTEASLAANPRFVVDAIPDEFELCATLNLKDQAVFTGELGPATSDDDVATVTSFWLPEDGNRAAGGLWVMSSSANPAAFDIPPGAEPEVESAPGAASNVWLVVATFPEGSVKVGGASKSSAEAIPTVGMSVFAPSEAEATKVGESVRIVDGQVDLSGAGLELQSEPFFGGQLGMPWGVVFQGAGGQLLLSKSPVDIDGQRFISAKWTAELKRAGKPTFPELEPVKVNGGDAIIEFGDATTAGILFEVGGNALSLVFMPDDSQIATQLFSGGFGAVAPFDVSDADRAAAIDLLVPIAEQVVPATPEQWGDYLLAAPTC